MSFLNVHHMQNKDVTWKQNYLNWVTHRSLTSDLLLNPPSKHRREVVQTVIAFLEEQTVLIESKIYGAS